MARSHPDLRSSRAARLAVAVACVAGACLSHGPLAAQQPAAGTGVATAQPAPRSPAKATGLPSGNSEMPIKLEAASSDFDYRNNSLLFKRVTITQGGLVVTAQQASATGLEFENSEWRLEGDVRITVPGGHLASSEARVLFRNNAIVRASIKGTPAAFEQRLREGDQVARGEAGAIDYNVQESTVRLTGDAWLSDGQNEIRGNTLVYDVGRERVQANPDEKDPAGVRITINPPKKKPAPTQGQGT
jgi:lipopolysaccharide transport protein LptA